MGIIGIVSEYNPFHRGHEYHINESKKQLGEDSSVICVMSGDFVQRGECAMFSKFARAEAAVKCGADLVVELPLPWAVSSAEAFARGAVGLLDALGATHISFGSENGNADVLDSIARTLMDDAITEEIKLLLDKEANMSYPVARQKVLERHIGDLAKELEQPNNILAVEYLKAKYELGSKIEAMTVRRLGSGHDKIGDDGPKSASELRGILRNGGDIGTYIPEAAYDVFKREKEQGRELSNSSIVEIAILSRLRMLGEKDFTSLPDASDGLGSRIYKAVQNSCSLNEVYEAAKTKRFTLARIRRVCMCACLGVKSGMNKGVPPYARILAANDKGCAILKSLKKSSDIVIVNKPAAIRKQSQECIDLFALGASAHDLYTLMYPAVGERKVQRDWKTNTIIVKDAQNAHKK